MNLKFLLKAVVYTRVDLRVQFPFPGIGFYAKIVEVEIVVSPSIVPSGNISELIRTVTCMVLKAQANDRRTSTPLLR
ncbi:hypothetical protein TNCV_3502181 [Trichonephila clavipes]|uniref:Uncharacterized protein n=1 Tax=Trichonephila clavipes TaxID=2585209 RepID=A0A8X6RX79_TRICX|nr:hypothetical protein TNCV_3502181 [Trichonephila clavipes]